MIIDLHTHSRPRSDDSDLDPGELVRLARQAGLDGVCLTEHDWHWDARDLAALSREMHFPVFSGMEISSDEGHLLVFGLGEYKFGMHHAAYVRELVDEVGGAIVLAHPYRRQVHYNPNPGELLDPLSENHIFDLVDAVEVLNGRSTDIENRFASDLGQRRGLRGAGGSDAHSSSDLPTCATEFEKTIRTIDELIHELKEGRFRAVDLRRCSG
ncbi:MAG: PHP domain-containing protein [Dehalococcoidia bacterium]|nr:PHP domain-containing protein [Dehalococcoidia bacterium]